MNRGAVRIVSAAAAAAAAAVLLLGAAAQVQAQVVGHPLIDRTSVDGASGSLFVDTATPLPAVGNVTNWGFFSNNVSAVNRQITPVIFELVGGSYVIRGIGTTRTNAASGAQTFAFGLVSGSDAVAANYFWGWKDTGQGVAEYDGTGPGAVRWFDNNDPFTVGTTPGPSADFIRTYSIQFTVTQTSAAAPEPGTLALLGAGSLLSVAAAVASRRRKRG